MKVIEGLKIGNECLNKMHQVPVSESAARAPASGWAEAWVLVAVSLQASLTRGFWLFFPGYVDRRSRKNNG